jgi:hypothetical protein
MRLCLRTGTHLARSESSRPAAVLTIQALRAGVTTPLPSSIRVACDPRIPTEFGAMPMQIAAVPEFHRVDRYIDGKLTASTADTQYPWPLQRGTHSVKALVWTDTADGAHATDDIRFYVH